MNNVMLDNINIFLLDQQIKRIEETSLSLQEDQRGQTSI